MKLIHALSIVIAISFLQTCSPQNKVKEYTYVDLSKFQDGIHHWELYSKIRTAERLDTADIIGISNQILAYQNQDGGWPKNIDWLALLNPDLVKENLDESHRKSTFDNRNIFPQIEYLSSVYQQTKLEKYKKASEKGFQYILDQQNPSGGWRGWDANVITFNDEVMTGIMNLLLDVKQKDEKYNWLSKDIRKKLLEAYEQGLTVILKCQIEIDGKKTAWCQQHNFGTYLPAQGRAYEHPSVTARESSDIIRFLMRISDPDTTIIQTILSSVNWLEESTINGYRYGNFPIEERPYHETTIAFDREFVPDSTALGVWARYYDLDSSKPFLSKKDGTIVYNLNEISFDRRVGYEWYGFWPKQVFDLFPEWKRLHIPTN